VLQKLVLLMYDVLTRVVILGALHEKTDPRSIVARWPLRPSLDWQQRRLVSERGIMVGGFSR
jgi:hypothetical protein